MSKLEVLKQSATLETFKDVEFLELAFNNKRQQFNIALVDYLQKEFSSTVSIKHDLDATYFSIEVTCYYWSEYREEKKEKLIDLISPLVKSMELYTDFIPDDENEIKMIFKVSIYHTL